MAQTAFPRPVTGLQPQTSLSASTICRPRPDFFVPVRRPEHRGAVGRVEHGAHDLAGPAEQAQAKRLAGAPSADRAACDTALATNSPTMASASSASETRPHSFSVFLVNFLAVRPDWAPVLSAHAATAGESHQSDGIRTTRGRPGAYSFSLAVKSSGRRTAGSTFVRVGNPTWLKPIATPRSLERQSQMIDANHILPEFRVSCKTKCTFICNVHLARPLVTEFHRRFK